MTEQGAAPYAYPAELLKKYSIVECLSHSAQGETLLVCGREDDAYYVAKLTRGGEAEPALPGELSHPALPRYVERIADGETYISVREYVEGEPLDEYMRERPLSDGQAVDICVQLCDALERLHGSRPR